MEIEHITPANGNVFADLGIPDAANEKLRAELIIALERWFQGSGLSQTKAAKELGVYRPLLSGLLHGQYELASLDQLVKMLDRVGVQVVMTTKAA